MACACGLTACSFLESSVQRFRTPVGQGSLKLRNLKLRVSRAPGRCSSGAWEPPGPSAVWGCYEHEGEEQLWAAPGAGEHGAPGGLGVAGVGG